MQLFKKIKIVSTILAIFDLPCLVSVPKLLKYLFTNTTSANLAQDCSNPAENLHFYKIDIWAC